MKRWQVFTPLNDLAKQASLASIHPVLLQVLSNRKITECSEIKNFLSAQLSNLSPVQSLPDIAKATLRMKRAFKEKERIFVVSDYDVDGVTSLAIFTSFLTAQKASYEFYIPLRLTHGYGLNKHAVDAARQAGARVLVTLDCGSNSPWVEYAQTSGLDVIIVDHHEISDDNLSFACINPKRKDSLYPFCDLSSAALTFRFVEAIQGFPPEEYLDLVALSVVCDVVPLLGENRILLKAGLEKIRKSPCCGIEALLESATIKKANVDVFHLGWILGPRLNASGRIASAETSFKLLSCLDKREAVRWAADLNEKNRERKSITDQLYASAVTQLEKEIDLDNDYVVVGCGERWHLGVLGIVASRIKEKFCRPTVLISFDDHGRGKGSARSVDNFHITEALFSCRDILEKVGGHQKAAGLEIKREHLARFKAILNATAKKALEGKQPEPTLSIDSKISFSQIDRALAEALALLEPYGEGNPEPCFLSQGVSLKNITVFGGKKVFWLTQDEYTYPCMCLQGELEDIFSLPERYDVIYTIKPDSIFGILLKAKDLRLFNGSG